ncbi:hydroxysqualene dehydroxylase HpnE [Sulfuriferula plumbiphila]|nr:hydroxysqualene dehydroxylase HpnE [Sulfuriferula plumbiphila]
MAHLDEGLTMHVAIIGGGYAGMAAAVTLAQHGIKAALFEASQTLGGRARRVILNDICLDNGQHLLLGAYSETLRLVKLVAPADAAWLRRPLQLHTLGGLRLSAPYLPAPLNTLLALLGARGMSAGERFRAIRFMLVQRRAHFKLRQDMPVAQLLAHHAQTAALVDKLWAPLCIAALNTPIATASAQVFLNVLRDSLARRRSDSDLVFPVRDLSALFPQPAADFVRTHGGAVTTGKTVEAITQTAAGFSVHGGNYTHLICAVAPYQATRLLAGLDELNQVRTLINAFHYQPIATVYLQYPAQVMLAKPMLGLAGGLAQWVFDRGITHHQHGLLAVVISAEGHHRKLAAAVLAQQVDAELRSALGALPAPHWHKVIVEKRATYSCDAGLQRPAQATALKNFYLAGDYTASDYPATLEAATQSGVKCAQLILEQT